MLQLMSIKLMSILCVYKRKRKREREKYTLFQYKTDINYLIRPLIYSLKRKLPEEKQSVIRWFMQRHVINAQSSLAGLLKSPSICSTDTVLQ